MDVVWRFTRSFAAFVIRRHCEVRAVMRGVPSGLELLLIHMAPARSQRVQGVAELSSSSLGHRSFSSRQRSQAVRRLLSWLMLDMYTALLCKGKIRRESYDA
jgi:hypothetical protein